MRRASLSALGLIALAASVSISAHASPTPSSPHPRLFMSDANLAAFKTNAGSKGTAAAALVAACQDTLDEPEQYASRGGSDGDYWPGSAMRCAFAFLATGKDEYRTQALKYWHASLDDDQTIGDKKGCVSGVSTNWQSWDGNPPAPPIILTVTHDTGYPMRWYAPDIALTYDWLYQANGVDDTLRAQTRTCLTAWSDYYTKSGYHADEAGANYNAGYVVGKTFTSIAIGTDGGSDGDLWTDTTGKLFPTLLVGQGLSGTSGQIGQPAGVMVGGDWGEGWEYGPLSVLEYAVSARALEENGQPLPEMDAWVDTLAVRYAYATLPDLSGQWVGGDFDDEAVYASPNVNEVDAVLAGPSTDTSASYAAFLKQAQKSDAGSYFYNALAELRSVSPSDFRATAPAPSRWYVARGTRAMYVRSSWDASALWGVFSSAPAVVDDHEHYSASNFVLSRGSDHLIVDPSEYGEPGSKATNAVTADSTIAQDDYVGTQTPWSDAELVWARGTDDAVYAARSDFASAFNFADTPSDIPYAHREWVMLPEGEVVTIDRVHTKDAAHDMHVRFHTNTGGGGLKLTGSMATGKVGGSDLVIHSVALSGGTPKVSQPETGDCSVSCSYPCGECDAARFAVDEYSVDVPGPEAVAIHVVDALASGSDAAVVDSINDDTIDPAPKQNAGVIGASVFSGTKQTFVLASSAADGASPTTMTYSVPGTSASRQIVFDAPEDGDGKSKVVGAAVSGRCEITITAGAGFAGHPLMFGVASAADGCTVTESTDVGPGKPTTTGSGGSGSASGPGATGSGSESTGSSHGGSGGGGSSSGDKSGCSCEVGEPASDSPLGFAAAALGIAVLARRSRRGTKIARMLSAALLLVGCSSKDQDGNGGEGGASTGASISTGAKSSGTISTSSSASSVGGASTGSTGDGGSGGGSSCEAFGHFPAPTNTFTLTISGDSIYYPDVQASFPSVDWATLDRLFIPAGNYKQFDLGNLPVRDASRPLVITNKGGQVKVGPDIGANFLWSMTGGSNWILSGRYDPDSETGDVGFQGHRCGAYDTSRGHYGFLSDDGFDITAPYLHMGVAITNATDFEVEFIEVEHSGFAGIRFLNQAKAQDDQPMSNIKLHDTYVHDTEGEGIYLGWTGGAPSNLMKNAQIYNNRFVRTGNEALQVQQLGEGSRVHHNVMLNGALHYRDNGLGAYQDNNSQVLMREGNVTIDHNVMDGSAALSLNLFGSPESGDADIHLVFKNNYLAENRVGTASYFNGNVTASSTYDWENNYFRALDFSYTIIDPSSTDAKIIFSQNSTMKAAINFSNNTWQGDESVTYSVQGANGTAGAITATGNTVGTVTPIDFRNTLDVSGTGLEYWTKATTRAPGSPERDYVPGDTVLYTDGIIYRCTKNNTNSSPPDHLDAWTALPSPVDDLRVKAGSPYEGIGVY